MRQGRFTLNYDVQSSVVSDLYFQLLVSRFVNSQWMSVYQPAKMSIAALMQVSGRKTKHIIFMLCVQTQVAPTATRILPSKKEHALAVSIGR